MKGEVGAESQEEGAQDKKPSGRLGQRQTEPSAEAVRTHTSTQTSHLRIMRVGLRLKGVIWDGAPCGERVTARSPRPASHTPAPPISPAPPPSCTPLSVYTQSACSSRKSQSYLDTTSLHDFCGLAGSQACPSAPPPSPPPSPGSRKGEGSGDALELGPQGERGRTTPTAWPEVRGGGMGEEA